MKTLIVGTGIIGTIYGWALTEAGNEVTHFVRPGRTFKNGVRLDVLDERKGHPKKQVTKYAIQCVDRISPADNYELIIVPTAAYQVEEALKMLVPVSGQATFLIFSGIWEGTHAIDRLLPRWRYLLGYADGGGTVRDGVYWTNLGSEVHLGLVEGGSADRLEQIKAMFVGADMQPDIQPNMLHWLMQHIAGTVGFAAGFARYGSVEAYLADKNMLRECILSTHELYKLCQLRGVDMKQFPETGWRTLPIWLVSVFLRWNFRHNESMQRYTAHAASEASAREMKAYYDSIIATAQEMGFTMPFTEALGGNLKKAA